MKRPKFFTQKQSELLCLIYPPPVGRGLTIVHACNLLSISETAGHIRLSNIKKRFPEAWQSFEAAREISRKHRIQLDGGATRGYSIEEKANENYDNNILEKF